MFVDDCSEECLSNYDMALDLIRKGESKLIFCIVICHALRRVCFHRESTLWRYKYE